MRTGAASTLVLQYGGLDYLRVPDDECQVPLRGGVSPNRGGVCLADALAQETVKCWNFDYSNVKTGCLAPEIAEA
jgi:hypothetical protein